MKKKRLIIPVLIIALGLAAYAIYQTRGVQDEGVLVASGNVEVTEMNVGFKIPGRVAERLKDEGDRVKKDEKLAFLDNAELAAMVSQSRAVLAESKVRLQELRTGSRLQEIDQSKANVKALEAEVIKAKRDFDRADILFKNGAISAAQFDAAKSAYDARVQQLAAITEQASLVKEGPRKEDIKASEHRVENAAASMAVAEEKWKDSFLYAPAPGVILRKNIEKGETVAAGTPVFTIGDIDNPWIKIYIRETNLGRVKLGQKAAVTTDSYPGKTYEGTVTFISSEAEFTPKTIQTKDERVKLVFGVKVSLKNPDQELKPGMPADVKLRLQ